MMSSKFKSCKKILNRRCQANTAPQALILLVSKTAKSQSNLEVTSHEKKKKGAIESARTTPENVSNPRKAKLSTCKMRCINSEMH